MADAEAPKAKRSKKVFLIPLVILLLGLGGGGYLLTSGSSKNASTTTTTAPGKIVRLAPVTLNLVGGNALKVALAIELSSSPKNKEIAQIVNPSGGGHGGGGGDDGSIPASPLAGQEARALDIAILTLGDMSYDELSTKGGRQHAKEILLQKLQEAYDGDVLDVYFTDFTMK